MPVFSYLVLGSSPLSTVQGERARTVLGNKINKLTKPQTNTGYRVQMCQLAVQPSKWIAVDPWEAIQPEYVPTAKVLDHFDHEINTVLGGVEDTNGKRTRVRIALLAGADLIQT